jgi:hypothetical protein
VKTVHIFLRNIYRRIVPENLRKIIGTAKRIVRRLILDRIYFDTLEARHGFLKYYNSDKLMPRDYPKTAVYMADGRCVLGGLSDRLRGIVSVYKFCKELNIAFKINFTNPFNLSDYLLPNIYDWHISPDEICYNEKQARPCFISDYGDFPSNIKSQTFWAKRFLREKFKQIHIYTNMLTAEKEYAALFHELFKPTPELRELIDYNVMKLGGTGRFISAAFRFLQLLGDFKESNEKLTVLPDSERKNLMGRCIENLEEIYSENDCAKMLVTSDSMSFLEETKRLPYVYVIPGEVRHIDTCKYTGKDVNTKLFLDYFVLSQSKKVYLVVDGQMYNSGFSYRAALTNNVPFIVKRY